MRHRCGQVGYLPSVAGQSVSYPHAHGDSRHVQAKPSLDQTHACLSCTFHRSRRAGSQNHAPLVHGRRLPPAQRHSPTPAAGRVFASRSAPGGPPHAGTPGHDECSLRVSPRARGDAGRVHPSVAPRHPPDAVPCPAGGHDATARPRPAARCAQRVVPSLPGGRVSARRRKPRVHDCASPAEVGALQLMAELLELAAAGHLPGQLVQRDLVPACGCPPSCPA